MTAAPPNGRVDFGAARKPIRLSRHVSAVVNTRAVLLILASAAGCVLVTIAAIVLGDYPVPLGQLLPILSGADRGFANTVVLEWRLPRAAAAIVFGAALGISGAIFQSVTRNPLGSPDIIGFNAGAFTGAIISIGFLGSSQTTTTLLALTGGGTAAFLVYGLAFRRGVSGTRFVVVGIAVSMALIAVNSLLVLRMEQQVATVAMTWGQGASTTSGGARSCRCARSWPSSSCARPYSAAGCGNSNSATTPPAPPVSPSSPCGSRSSLSGLRLRPW